MARDLASNSFSIRAPELAGWQANGTIEYLVHLNDVCPAFAAARVYVPPSYCEDTPRMVLEAMAMGRPILTTDTLGCRETVVEGRNGFPVPVRDVDTRRRRWSRSWRSASGGRDWRSRGRSTMCTK